MFPKSFDQVLLRFSPENQKEFMDIIASFIDGPAESNIEKEILQDRSVKLALALVMALHEMKEKGEAKINKRDFRRYIFLGKGFSRKKLGGRDIEKIEDVPEKAWVEARRNPGMINLHLRGLKNEFSAETALAIKDFFDVLPGFSLQKAMNGQPQHVNIQERHGILSKRILQGIKDFEKR